jgi:hypothetical protein
VRLLPLIIFFTSSLLGIAEEDFPVLSLQRKKWEEARSSAEAKVDKSYLSRLEELKKDSVKKGDLDAARAFDKAIKGEAKGDEEEPAALTKMRTARDKALEAAFKPVDKQYWEDLKLLKGFSQREGDLEKMELVVAEINKVLAPYKQESDPQEAGHTSSLWNKADDDYLSEVSLTELKPLLKKAGDVENSPERINDWWEVKTAEDTSERSLIVDGVDCDRFIFAHAPSNANYTIPLFAKFFSAVGAGTGGNSYKFIIKIDREVFFESQKLSSYKTSSIPVIVEIPKGSKVIELIIDEMGSMNNDNSAWANPVFRSKKPTAKQVLSLK